MEYINKKKGRILVIDDEEVIRAIAAEIIDECGYESIGINSGEEAIAFFKENYKKIDIVVLDMQMPELSGKDIFIQLKKIDPSVKVLLSSGYKFNERIEEIVSLGVKGFLEKPYTLNDFSEAINKII